MYIVTVLCTYLKDKKKPKETIVTDHKSGEEEYHDYAHRMILRHGLMTIDKICRKCEYRKEEMESGGTRELWINKYGDYVKMLRSDGVGYIQLFNERCEAFGAIWINPGEEPSASVICNSNQFRTNMQWFLANH